MDAYDYYYRSYDDSVSTLDKLERENPLFAEFLKVRNQAGYIGIFHFSLFLVLLEGTGEDARM